MVGNVLPAETPTPTDPDPGDGVNRSKLNFFLEHGHVAYQNKGNHQMVQHGSTRFIHARLCKIQGLFKDF